MNAGRAPKNGGMQKDTRRLVKAATDAGWAICAHRRKHWQLRAPDGVTIVVVPCSPSDWRGYLNLRAQLRRGGLKV